MKRPLLSHQPVMSDLSQQFVSSALPCKAISQGQWVMLLRCALQQVQTLSAVAVTLHAVQLVTVHVAFA